MPLSQLVAYYAAKPVKIVDPVILIRVNRRYWHGMPDLELYEVTRGVWKIGERRNRAKYALAVFEAVVREVYTIATWHKAGTTPYKTRTLEDVKWPGRWEFTGAPASLEIRNRYLYRFVGQYVQSGSRNPIAYVNS